MSEVKIGKKDVSRYAQLECPQQLKYKLKNIPGIEAGVKRPGVKHITDKGNEYETSIYNDLIQILDAKQIAYNQDIESNRFVSVNLLQELKKDIPPTIILEGEFETPNIFNYDTKNFYFSKSRPDILYIKKDCESEKYCISIIDIKTTNEPSLKHFSEISFYRLVLEEFLKLNGLDERYCFEDFGYVLPGNNDKYLFIDTYEKFKRESPSPLNDSLEKILISIPYEIYEPYVLNFFNTILPRINEQSDEEIICQFNAKCQFCDYESECRKNSKKFEKIDQVPFLTNGQHQLLVQEGIFTLTNLIEHIEGKTQLWKQITTINRNLKSQEQVILDRAKAIKLNKIVPFENRKTYLMPQWANLNIFVTIHFDPITGLAFGLGASKVYKDKGIKSEEDSTINIVRRNNGLDLKYERDVFLNFLIKINKWINEFLKKNKEVQGIDQRNLKSIHFYFWNQIEITQLRRMLLRHLNDIKIKKELSLLISLYPAEGHKDNPNLYETQPGTVVKDTIKYLFGLPIAHDYNLFNVINALYQEHNVINQNTGELIQYNPRRGFFVDMSDQIPFERAYEIWTGNVYLTKEFRSKDAKNTYDYFDIISKRIPIDRNELLEIKYEAHEIEELMDSAIQRRLDILKRVVQTVQNNYGDKLLLEKKKVKIFSTKKIGMEEASVNLQMFEKLNHIASDIENKQLRVLPIEEKESKFMSIRGLKLQEQTKYINIIKRLQEKEEYLSTNLDEFMVFTYSQDSLEAKIKEGDFLVVLSNEVDPRNPTMPQLNLETCIRNLTSENPDELLALGKTFSLKNIQNPKSKRSNFWYLTLKDLLKVTVAYVSYDLEQLTLIVVPNDYYGGINIFKFLSHLNLINFNYPFILDPIYQDFNQKDFENIFRTIGKK